jgi:uncharacterized protein YdaU (DUF1376 family)
MTARHPYMPLYIADYELDTRHLTAAEDGIYGRLLRALWTAGGTLPADDKFLAKTCRVSMALWRRASATIMAFFRVAEGVISQKRVTLELEKAGRISRVRSEAAKNKEKAKTGITSHDSKNGSHLPDNPLKNNDAEQANASARGPVSGTRPRLASLEGSGSGSTPLRSVELSGSLRSPSSAPEVADFQLTPDEPEQPKAKEPPVSEALKAYAALAERTGLPKVEKLTDQRRKKLRSILAEHGIETWRRALAMVEASNHCLGRNDRGWTASLDFLLQPSSFVKVIEGNYANRTPAPAANGNGFTSGFEGRKDRSALFERMREGTL